MHQLQPDKYENCGQTRDPDRYPGVGEKASPINDPRSAAVACLGQRRARSFRVRAFSSTRQAQRFVSVLTDISKYPITLVLENTIFNRRASARLVELPSSITPTNLKLLRAISVNQHLTPHRQTILPVSIDLSEMRIATRPRKEYLRREFDEMKDKGYHNGNG